MFESLLAAQVANDCRAESLAMQEFFPSRLGSGQQHQNEPIHIRLLRRIRFGLTDCWHWCGPTNHFGYGRFSYRGKATVAHRISYEVFKGEVIPPGMSILHSCDNPSCVNPDHLRVGTYTENRRDCLAKGRWKPRIRRGLDSPLSVVTSGMLLRMKELRAEGKSFAAIGRLVGVSASTAWKALSDKYGEQS